MNSIRLQDIGKKFGQQTVFSGITLELHQGENLSIIGYNGSGKSTLLQIISGYVTPSQGSVNFTVSGTPVAEDKKYTRIAFAAPYQDLIEEFTALETVEFYREFKSFPSAITGDEVLEKAELIKAAGKQVRFFSSGMKQRLKLTLAVLSETPFLLLDEPVSNLDKPGVRWFHKLLETNLTNRILIVSSNEVEDEMRFCSASIRIEDYKR